MKEKDENEKNINDFIDIQLNVFQVAVTEIDNDEKKLQILKSEYSDKNEKITHFLMIIIQSDNMSRQAFHQFHKQSLKYLVQDSYLFHQHSQNISLCHVIYSISY